MPLTITQYPSKLRAARGGCGRMPFTATTKTTRSPGCASNFAFAAAVAASNNSSSARLELIPFVLLLLLLPSLFPLEEGLGVFGPSGEPARAIRLLRRGLITPLAGETSPPFRPPPATCRCSEQGEREEPRFVGVRVPPRALWRGDREAVVGDEAPAFRDLRGVGDPC